MAYCFGDCKVPSLYRGYYDGAYKQNDLFYIETCVDRQTARYCHSPFFALMGSRRFNTSMSTLNETIHACFVHFNLRNFSRVKVVLGVAI